MLIAVLGPLGALNALAASSLSDKVSNAQREATVSVSFNGPPDYAFFPLHGPDRVVLDVNQKGKVGGLPLNSAAKPRKAFAPARRKTLRACALVFDLTQRAKTRVSTRQNGSVHTVVFTITAEGSANTVVRKAPVQTPPVAVNHHRVRHRSRCVKRRPPLRKAPTGSNPFTNKQSVVAGTATEVTPRSSRVSAGSGDRVVVAIDASRGGGSGRHWPERAERKNVTIAIARRLQAMLDADPQFKPVLTRNGDYFISVMGRSDVARKQAPTCWSPSTPTPRQTAAPAGLPFGCCPTAAPTAKWPVGSNSMRAVRAAAAPAICWPTAADPYLSRAVLDLQFGRSQRVGYDVAVRSAAAAAERRIAAQTPAGTRQHGRARSPDIPSLLVETGLSVIARRAAAGRSVSGEDCQGHS